MWVWQLYLFQAVQWLFHMFAVVYEWYADCCEKKDIQKLKAQLKEKFDMKDLGEAKKILDMKIIRDRSKGKLCYLRSIMLSRC